MGTPASPIEQLYPQTEAHYVRLLDAVPQFHKDGLTIKLFCLCPDELPLTAAVEAEGFEHVEAYIDALRSTRHLPESEAPVILVPVVKTEMGWSFSAITALRDKQQAGAGTPPPQVGDVMLQIRMPRTAVTALDQLVHQRSTTRQDLLKHLIASALA